LQVSEQNRGPNVLPGMSALFTELKRRNIYKVAVAYAIVAWLLIQAASILLPTFEAPTWVMKVFISAIVLGFPAALIFAWAFEITPEGIKRAEDVDLSKSTTHRTGRKLDFLIIAVLLLVIAVFAYQRFGQGRKDPAAVPEKSIAVLPFENLSRDPDNAFFTDGVQDEILTNLARIADLKVISRTSVMQYKTGAGRNHREIGQQLGVAHLLEGSVQRAGNKVRLIAQLIDARSDAHLWAQTYDRDLADVFAIQSEIAKAIADQLRAKLSPVEKSAIERPPTSDVVAFDLYSRAKNLDLMAGANFATNEKNLPQAIDLLKQATARDPDFFLAHCLLAYAHDRVYFFLIDRTPERLAQAQAALEAAARLRPEAGETHLAKAYHLYWGSLDYAGAMAELEIARRSLPNEARVYELPGYIARRQGKWEESLRYLARALELDPRNFLTLTQTAISYQRLRRDTEAAAIYDRALAIYPDNLDAQFNRAELDVDSKADTRAYRRVLDELRRKDPTAFKERAADAFSLAMWDRNVPAAEAALLALGDTPIRDNVLVYNAKANAAFLARMANNEEKARAAFAAAREEQEKTVQAQPNSGGALVVLGLYEAALGRKEEALRDGRRAMELLPVEKDALNGARVITVFATIAAWVGEKDLALEHLAQAVQLPAGPTYGVLKLGVDWDPLRGDPGFEKIVADLAPKSAAK
jgi:TolB-like protein/Tfp pilus assembly protein PilF